MRLRIVAAAFVAAAFALPQSPATAWTCYSSGVVKVCDLLTNRPEVCAYPGGPGECFEAQTDVLCVYHNGAPIVCPPIVWPPV
jgi:hypothetical protein